MPIISKVLTAVPCCHIQTASKGGKCLQEQSCCTVTKLRAVSEKALQILSIQAQQHQILKIYCRTPSLKQLLFSASLCLKGKHTGGKSNCRGKTLTGENPFQFAKCRFWISDIYWLVFSIKLNSIPLQLCQRSSHHKQLQGESVCVHTGTCDYTIYLLIHKSTKGNFEMHKFASYECRVWSVREQGKTPPTTTAIPPPSTPRDSQPGCGWHFVWMLSLLTMRSTRGSPPGCWRPNTVVYADFLSGSAIQKNSQAGTWRDDEQLASRLQRRSSHPALASLQPIPFTAKQLMWLVMQFLDHLNQKHVKALKKVHLSFPPSTSTSAQQQHLHGGSRLRQQGVGTRPILLCTASQQMASRSNLNVCLVYITHIYFTCS